LLEDLAAKIGAPVEALRATVGRYNDLCDQGRDADFVKPEGSANIPVQAMLQA
jgi:hypothetical protein